VKLNPRLGISLFTYYYHILYSLSIITFYIQLTSKWPILQASCLGAGYPSDFMCDFMSDLL
jgi:hypothetical protein